MRGKPRGNKRWNAIAQAVTAVSQLAVTLLLVRLLDPGDFGRVALVYLVAGLAAILDEGGLSTGIVAAEERRPARLNAIFWQEVLVGCVIAALVWLLAEPLGRAYGQADLRSFLRALAPMFVVTAPRRYAQAVLYRDYRFMGMGLARILAAVGFVVVTAACGALGYGVWSLVFGLVTRMTIESVGFVVAAWGRLRVGRPPANPLRSAPGWGGLAKVGERVMNYGADRVDLLIIGLVLGPTALGVYDVFKRTSIGLYQQVIPAFSRVALPHLARLRDRPLVLAEAYARQLRYICLLLFPAYLFQAVFARELVTVVFGGDWAGYAPVFLWISLLLLVRSTNGPIDALLMARGWVKRELAYSVIAVGLLAGALLLAVGEGLEAAVVAVTAVNLAMCVPVYVWLVRPAGYVGREQYLRAVGLPLALAMLATLGGVLLADGVGGSAAARLAAGAATTTVIFAGGVLAGYPSVRAWAMGRVGRLGESRI